MQKIHINEEGLGVLYIVFTVFIYDIEDQHGWLAFQRDFETSIEQNLSFRASDSSYVQKYFRYLSMTPNHQDIYLETVLYTLVGVHSRMTASASNLVLPNAADSKGTMVCTSSHLSLSNKIRAPPDIHGWTTADVNSTDSIYKSQCRQKVSHLCLSLAIAVIGDTSTVYAEHVKTSRINNFSW
jgi:hypothetical protein